MATAKKSIKVPVNFGNIADVADNVLTTLGTPTIYIPENSVGNPVTITSVILYVAQQSTGATNQTIASPSFTLTLSGAGASTVTMTGTSGQSGEDTSGILGPVDFTSYFVTNYGTVTSKACTVAITFNTSAGTTVGAFAWFEITYEYDDTAATRIQTICIPYESSTGALPISTTTYCTLKQLTDTGGILDGYANVVIRHRWIEIKGNTNGSGNTTDMNLSYRFDAGTTQALPLKEMGGNEDNWAIYQVDSSGITSTDAHTFSLWNSSIASRWYNIIVNEWVSFEYTTSGTTSVLNYIEIPIEFESPIDGTTSANSHIFSRNILIPEPGTISLVKGAVELQYNTAASATVDISAGAQASFRSYAMAAATVAGQFTLNHGLDADSALGAAYTLTRGENNLTVSLYRTVGAMSNVSGIIRLLYSSDVASSGIATHSRTVYSFIRQMSLTATADDTLSDSFQIPETNYWLQGAGILYSVYAQTALMVLMVQARLQSGEGAGDGWRELYNDQYSADNEYSFGGWVVRARDEFKRYPTDPDKNRMDIETIRNFRTTMSTASRYGSRWMVSYHSITYTISGTISNSSGGTVNIALYQENADGEYIPYDTTTRSGNGSYSFTVYDDTTNYYVAAYESDILKGLSQQSTPDTGFDIDLAGGGGEFFF